MMTLLRELTMSKPPLAEAVEQVLTVFKDFGEPADASEAERRVLLSRQSDQMLADLLSIGPARQYRHLRELFGDFAADLRSIADLPSAGSARLPSTRKLAWLAAEWAPLPL